MPRSRLFASLIGIFSLAIVFVFGVLWCFQRGGHDFGVFHHAWTLAISGHGNEIYQNSPDRFLYAPGFAWLFAPLGWLPRPLALGFWNVAKIAVIVGVVRAFQMHLDRRLPFGVFALGVAILAKPLLIDFQYGQINILIQGACVWALLTHFSRTTKSKTRALAWFIMGIAAVSKLLAMPLLLVPWLTLAPTKTRSQELWAERLAGAAGVLLVLILPFIVLGFSGGWEQTLQWKHALLLKGMPLETHNQSLVAFLHHSFGGTTVPYIAMSRRVPGGWELLGADTISVIGTLWALLCLALLVLWILVTQRASGSKNSALVTASLIGMTILPSHLVWKPYFVMGVPLAICAVYDATLHRKHLPWLLVIFLAVNFTGFDFIGYENAARLEAAALLFFTHLALLILVMLAWRKIRTKELPAETFQTDL